MDKFFAIIATQQIELHRKARAQQSRISPEKRPSMRVNLGAINLQSNN
jgi:hypothetical protein